MKRNAISTFKCAERLALANLRTLARAFLKREGGAVAISAAIGTVVFLGFAGLAVEYSGLLVARAEAQRTADLASHAGAVAFKRTGDTTAVREAAVGIARLNGFEASKVEVTFETSPNSGSGQAVRATIRVPKPLVLSRFAGSEGSVDVIASAVAGTLDGAPACIQALDPNGPGITLSGGTTMRTEACAVASNSEVEARCGTSIVTRKLTYDSGGPPDTGNCNTITKPEGGVSDITQSPTTDPLQGTDVISGIAEQMSRTGELLAPVDFSVTQGPDISFGWNEEKTKKPLMNTGCDAALSGSVWTLTCAGQSTVNLGDIELGGGLELEFNPGALSNVVYNISGVIENGGSRMTFAGGTYNVAKGIVTAGGSVTEFGAGTYRVGRIEKICGGATFSICNSSTLTFDGPSAFVFSAGIMNGGGASMILGTGDGNSFRIGPSSTDEAISIGGGSALLMGDANDGVFEVVGMIDGGGGGSCVTIPAAPLHEINGSISMSGAVRFGEGLYAIDGYMHMGGNGGASAPCGGEIISVEAVGATFSIAAKDTSNKWGCKEQAFCIASGYRNTRFIAPESGPYTDLAVIGPLDPGNELGAEFRAGARGSSVSGAFYFPNGSISTSGGASVDGGGDTGCLQLIGASISMSGGTSVASECRLPQTEVSGKVVIFE